MASALLADRGGSTTAHRLWRGPARVCRALLKLHRPTLVLCLGQAGGRAALSIGRVAINLVDARIPDNRRAAARGLNLYCLSPRPCSPLCQRAVEAMLQAVRACGHLPGEVSLSAGSLCLQCGVL